MSESGLGQYSVEALEAELETRRRKVKLGHTFVLRHAWHQDNRNVTIINVHSQLLRPEVRDRVFFIDNSTHHVYAATPEDFAGRAGITVESLEDVNWQRTA